MNTQKKIKILLVQLGSPASPSKKDVKEFLKEFLGDPRVVDINPFFWKIILNLFILPFRPKKSAQLYARIWDNEKKEFPLPKYTKALAQQCHEWFKNNYPQKNIEVDHCFLLKTPRYSDILDKWNKQQKDRSCHWYIVPLFPQYSESTTASVLDLWAKELATRVEFPTFSFFTQFHLSKAFIDCSVDRIEATLNSKQFEADALVISFHGIPKRRVVIKKDPYYLHCYQTYLLLRSKIRSIAPHKIHLTFQSRFGSEEWLGPYTDEYVLKLIDNGAKDIAVYCPSFVADCLETSDEIGNELSKEANEKGGKIHLVPCLNDSKNWTAQFSQWLHSKIDPSQNDSSLEYNTNENPLNQVVPLPELKSPPLTKESKSVIKIIFLTLFLDLVGFSIIFPLFPALAKHYLLVDGDNYFLNLIFGTVTSFTGLAGVQDGQINFTPIVLFGGILGALYSLLQFLAAPLWGGISDRIGRRPVLIFSVAGLALSYLLWFFSGNFSLLILARFIGGIMGGNISTATAVVADVTVEKNRSKGMAFIGIAFALGFIIGPAMGGILSLIDLSQVYPQLTSWGVNPFSMPAALAFILSMFNLFYLIKRFPETWTKEKRQKQKAANRSTRSVNPFTLFKPLPYRGVNLTNFGNFFFLTIFSGMEFTLTFLAVERLKYTSLNNAYMFIFIGVVLALIQGGVVRRKAAAIGERKMALTGLILIIPGLICVGLTQTTALLYVGLTFLACGSALVIPCLTALVSLYTPAYEQGISIGIFRSLGALARVIGPLLACLVYWQWGSSSPYFLGSALLLVPILMTAMLPNPENTKIEEAQSNKILKEQNTSA